MNQIRFYTLDDCSKVEKGWGNEQVIAQEYLALDGCADLRAGYCGKLLNYKKNGCSSLHYHMRKHETFYILNGEFILKYFGLRDAEERVKNLKSGDVVVIPPGNPHQLKCVSAGKYTFGCIMEFSTPEADDDNYRIAKGDSQKI